jgi:hypothetical protein
VHNKYRYGLAINNVGTDNYDFACKIHSTHAWSENGKRADCYRSWLMVAVCRTSSLIFGYMAVATIIMEYTYIVISLLTFLQIFSFR